VERNNLSNLLRSDMCIKFKKKRVMFGEKVKGKIFLSSRR